MTKVLHHGLVSDLVSFVLFYVIVLFCLDTADATLRRYGREQLLGDKVVVIVDAAG